MTVYPGGLVTEYLDSPVPEAAVRLFCFPYAGGGSALYRRWRARLGPEVAVCPVHLPGRERRAKQARFTDMGALVAQLQAELGPYLDTPHIFFGHSMGALVAYRLAQRRWADGAVLPRAMLLSSAAPPGGSRLPLPAGPGLGATAGSGRQNERSPGDPENPAWGPDGSRVGTRRIVKRSDGSNDLTGIMISREHAVAEGDQPALRGTMHPGAGELALARQLVELGGLPEGVLARPDWLEILLPVVSDDLLLCASDGDRTGQGAQDSEHPRLPVPFHLFGGRDDPIVPAAELALWRCHSALDTDLALFDGGHFYLRDDPDGFLPTLRAAIGRYITAPAGPPIGAGTSTNRTAA